MANGGGPHVHDERKPVTTKETQAASATRSAADVKKPTSK